MKELTNELLVEAYFAALKHNLDRHFIHLLLLEIIERKITLQEVPYYHKSKSS